MSKRAPIWKFPSNNGGNISGLNETGITQFQATPISSVTKETLQDSLDAKRYPELPSIVKFSVENMPIENIPDGVGLLKIFNAGKDYWATHEDSRNFFENGIHTLEKENIKVMAIRDYNTTGLSEIDADTTHKSSGGWVALVRSTGVTEKGPQSSGSFGIGKHAPFAASKVHTVLYGSRNIANQYGFQGVSKIASFTDENGETSQGTGYFGFAEGKEFKPLLAEDRHLLSEYFLRDKIGTDKFIIGVDIDDDFDWEFEVLKQAISSFMLAINDGNLEVHIGEFILNANTLSDAIKKIEHREPDNILIEFYKALTSEQRKVSVGKFQTPDGEEEEIELYLLANEGFKKKVVMYRGTGMQIFTKGHFRTPIEFAGVLFVKGAKLNAILRKMEPPTHDKWDANLYKKDIKYAKGLLKEILQWLSKETKTLIDTSNVDSVELKGLERLLPDVSKKEAAIVDIGRKQAQLKTKRIEKRKVKKTTRNRTGEPGNDEKGKIPGNSNLDGKGEKTGNTGTENPGNSKPSKLAKISRTIPYCTNEQNGLYTVKIWPATVGERSFTLKIIGEDNKPSDIEILEVSLPDGTKIPLAENQFGPIQFNSTDLLNVNVKIKSRNKLALEVYTK